KLQQANPNYTLESANVTGGQFHITAAPVTIIAPTLTKSYDGQSYTGNDNQAKVVGQQAAKLNYSLTDLSQDTNVQNDGYAITVQLGDNPNYNVKTVAGKLTITPNTQATVQVQDSTKFYDGTTQADTT
ncbi:hypothetical protein, partial [Secundilactobacillus silagincola]|uniref:hypothetical protein n=1 Tax=Secundilactobacillus silagincola TaxID=1714681 RepID=UPI0015D4CDFD